MKNTLLWSRKTSLFTIRGHLRLAQDPLLGPSGTASTGYTDSLTMTLPVRLCPLETTPSGMPVGRPQKSWLGQIDRKATGMSRGPGWWLTRRHPHSGKRRKDVLMPTAQRQPFGSRDCTAKQRSST